MAVNFVINISMPTGNAVASAGKVKRGLESVDAAANKTRTGLMGLHQAFNSVGNAAAKSAAQAAAALQKAQAAAKALRQEQMLMGAAAGYGLLRIAGVVADVANAYDSMANRLRSVTNSDGELRASLEMTYGIAQRSRQGWTETNELYVRIRRATQGLGIDATQSARATETLGKMVAMSGATTTEASAAMLQFSQALASNRLGGDEFRSVAEQMPALLDAMAAHLGVPRNELRALAKQGKLTADVMMGSLAGAAASTDKAFAKLTPTIAQSMTVLRNSIIQGFGEFLHSSGIASGFATAVGFLRDNMQTLIPIIIAVAKAITVILVGQAIKGALAALETLRLAALANPFTAIAAGVMFLMTISPEFNNFATGIIGELYDMASAAANAAASIGQTLGNAIRSLPGMGSNDEAWVNATGGTKFAGQTKKTDFGGPKDTLGDTMASYYKQGDPGREAAQAAVRHLYEAEAIQDAGLRKKALQDLVKEEEALIIAEKGMMDPNKLAQGYLTKFQQAQAASNAYTASQILARAADEEALKLTDKQIEEYDKLKQSLNPIAAANDQMTKGMDLLRATFDSGAISLAEYSAQMGRLMTSLGAARDPSSAFTDDLERQVEILRLPEKQRGKQTYLDSAREELVGKGLLGFEADALLEKNKALIDEKFALENADKAAKGAGRAHKELVAALEGAKKALRSLMDSLYPVVAAWNALYDAQRIVNDSIKRGFIDQQRGAEIMKRYGEVNAEALDPLNALSLGMEEHIKLLGMTTTEQEKFTRHQELQKAVDASGVSQIEAQTYALHELLDTEIAMEKARERADAKIAARLAAEKETLQIRRDVAALHVATQTQNRIDSQKPGYVSIDQQYLDKRDRVAAEDYKKINPTQYALGELVDQAMKVNETFEIMQIGINGLQSALVELATTGKLNFKSLVDGMRADLARLAAQQFMRSLLGLAMGGSGGAAVSAVKILSGGGHSDGSFSSALTGNSTGGSWLVGGGGGTDSQTVAFRASPWERITVTNPGSQQAADHRGSSGGTAPADLKVHIVNQMDRSDFLSVLDSPAGQRKIVNIIGQRRGAVRGMLH